MAQYDWAIIGAGPAGIAAVGKLLDHGVTPGKIAWLDPHYAAGDLGAKWRAVPSNTVVELFLRYLNDSPSFQFHNAPPFTITELDPQQTCHLGLVADPLVWITEQLREKVAAHQTTATELHLSGRAWTVGTEQGVITAANVVLATGATARKLDYPGLTDIDLEVALDPAKLAQQPLDGATIAVFGSSHSSMIALPNLLDLPVKKVINFYRSPLRYAVSQGDWTLFDDVGLKGQAAEWARQNIDGEPPERLERVHVNDPKFSEHLAECDHVVYTVGLDRRELPATPQWGRLDYNPANGIIAPGLFGFGVAFPEYRSDPLGFGQYRVGLDKFREYITTALPLWTSYPV